MTLAESALAARSEEAILSGRVRLRLGGVDFWVPVLTIDQNREFKGRLVAEAEALIAVMDEQTELGALVRRLAQGTALQLECLQLYDRAHALPDLAWIGAHATEQELWDATREVISAAFPFVDGLRQVGPSLLELVRTIRGSSLSSSPRGTDGRRGLFRRN